MADEGERQTEFLDEIFQQVQHLRLRGHVQAGNNLIGQNEIRPQRDGAGDADALALAA